MNLMAKPLLTAEVLSPGNARIVRDNLRGCSTIPTLQAMLVVHSDRGLIEACRRAPDGTWPEPEHIGPGGRLQLPSMGVDCPVEDAYLDTWLLHWDE